MRTRERARARAHAPRTQWLVVMTAKALLHSGGQGMVKIKNLEKVSSEKGSEVDVARKDVLRFLAPMSAKSRAKP